MECSEAAGDPAMDIQISSVFSLPLETYLNGGEKVASISAASTPDNRNYVGLDSPQCRGASVVLENIDSYLMGRNRVHFRQWMRRFNRCGQVCRQKHVEKITGHLQQKPPEELIREEVRRLIERGKSLKPRNHKMSSSSLKKRKIHDFFTSSGRPKFQSLTHLMKNKTFPEKVNLKKSPSKKKYDLQYRSATTVRSLIAATKPHLNLQSLPSFIRFKHKKSKKAMMKEKTEQERHVTPALLNFKDLSGNVPILNEQCTTADDKSKLNDSNFSVEDTDIRQAGCTHQTTDNSNNASNSLVENPSSVKIKEEPLSLKEFKVGRTEYQGHCQSVIQGSKVQVKVEPGLHNSAHTSKDSRIQHGRESKPGNIKTNNFNVQSTQKKDNKAKQTIPMDNPCKLLPLKKYLSLKGNDYKYPPAEKKVKIAPRLAPKESKINEPSSLGSIPSVVTSETSPSMETVTVSTKAKPPSSHTAPTAMNNQNVIKDPSKAGFILANINGKAVLINPNHALTSNPGKKPFLVNQNEPFVKPLPPENQTIGKSLPPENQTIGKSLPPVNPPIVKPVPPAVPRQSSVSQIPQFLTLNTPVSSAIGQQQVIPVVTHPSAVGIQRQFVPIINNAGTIGLVNGGNVLPTQHQFLSVVSQASPLITGQPQLNLACAKQSTLMIPQLLQQTLIAQGTSPSQPNQNLQTILNLEPPKLYGGTNVSTAQPGLSEKNKPVVTQRSDSAVTVVLSDAVKQPTTGFLLPSGHLVLDRVQQPQQASALSYTAHSSALNNQPSVQLTSTQNIQLGTMLLQPNVQMAAQKTPVQNVITQLLTNNLQQAQSNDIQTAVATKLTDTSANQMKKGTEAAENIQVPSYANSAFLIGQPRVQNTYTDGSFNPQFGESNLSSCAKLEESTIKSPRKSDTETDTIQGKVVTINGQQYVLVPKTDAQTTPAVKTSFEATRRLQTAAEMRSCNKQLQDNGVSSSRSGGLMLKRGPILTGNKFPYQKTKLSTNDAVVAKLKTKLDELRTESRYRKITPNESSPSKISSVNTEKTTQTTLCRQKSHEDKSPEVIVIDDQCVSPLKKHPRKSKPQPRIEYDDLTRKDTLVPSNPILPQGSFNWPQDATIHEKKITLPDTILNELRAKPISDWPGIGQIVPHRTMDNEGN